MYNNLRPITHLPTLIKKQQQYIDDIQRIDDLLKSKKYNWTTENIERLKLSRNRIENDLHNINCWIKNIS